MTVQLTTKLKLFIERMTKSEEQAQWGYELLLKRPDFDEFFDHLKNAGLFGREHNRGPVPADQPGYVSVPYWHALDYLEAVAKRGGETNNIQLSEKVLDIVRVVSEAREPDGSIRDNYHTYRKFAGILGLVPTASVTQAHIDLIPGWMAGRYERGMVCHALDVGLMRRLLSSDSPDDWVKAISVLRHCTAVLWVEDESLGRNNKKVITIVEDHRLKGFIDNHGVALGKRVGQKAAEVFVERLRQTYDRTNRDLPTWLHRPAIEDHVQNHEWMGPENRFVEGLREVLLSWVDTDKSSAQIFIQRLMVDEGYILRRIGLYVIDRRWHALKEVFSECVGPPLFSDELLHETYGLLQRHFGSFNDTDKARIVKAIRQLTTVSDDEDNRRLRRVQNNWLSTLVGKGYEPADTWFNELKSDPSIGPLSEHPDFHSYMESWSGHGPSPYQPQELVVLAENGSLIDKLNDFRETDSWRGPTTRALVDSLEAAIALAPNNFLRLLQTFTAAKRPFQYAIINGFMEIWTKSGQQEHQLDWNKAWPEIIRFFEQLVGTRAFWKEQALTDHNFSPNKDWIPPAIANFLRSGTQDDEKAYAPDLLPKTWKLLVILLENLDWQDEFPKSDSMTQAINSSRGKAIEAVFSHALRACRLANQERQQHADVWASMKPVFDSELAKCQNANYEFSTLAGAYVTHLHYMDRVWLKVQIRKIFPTEIQDNFSCALGGLAYANVTRPVYTLMVESGVIDDALRLPIADRRVIEKLVERIALAYLWNDEQLDSPRIEHLFQTGQIDTIDHAIGWFWGVREEQLSGEQVERIMKYWERCVSWSRSLPEPPVKLLSSLSRLACYIGSINHREQDLLMAVAPYVHVAHYYDFFYEELDRLADTNTEAVAITLKESLNTHVPYIDFEDKLKSILTKLARGGQRPAAIVLADCLKQIPGMTQFFKNLLGGNE
jgi:hypothetical protein